MPCTAEPPSNGGRIRRSPTRSGRTRRSKLEPGVGLQGRQSPEVRGPLSARTAALLMVSPLCLKS
jgi:hypothetical protein